MWTYVARRLLVNVPALLGILLVLVLLLRHGLSDPVYAFLGKGAGEADVARLRGELGLDRPVLVQYAELVRDVVTLDFARESWSRPGRSAGELLRTALPATLSLTLPALALTTLLALLLGLLSARFRDRALDRAIRLCAAAGMSVSVLVWVLLGQYWGAFRLSRAVGREVFAVQGWEPSLAGWLRHGLLPVLLLAVAALGYEVRHARAALVEESEREWIVAARAKGLSPARVLRSHVLRNALLPVVTRVMVALPFLLTGSVVVEHFFGIPGMGQRLLAAVSERDFPVVEAFTAVFALVFVVSNVLTDVLYALVDPRVRLP